ncbi:MAG: PolC-type DNA polymerase III [Clostridia bacterium]|nr:PolC-type DNA polymerase III [Clostridia bacterium]
MNNSFLEQHINWNRLAPHDRGELKVTIEKAELSKENMVLNIYFRANFVMPFSDLQSFLKDLCDSVPGISSVKYHFIYENIVQSREEIIHLYLPYILRDERLSGLSQICRTVDHQCLRIREDGVVEIMILGGNNVDRFNSLASKMSECFRANFGMDQKFVFVNNDAAVEERTRMQQEQEKIELARMEEQRRIAAENARNNPPEPAQGGYGGWNGGGQKRQSRKYEGPVDGNRFIGKPISGNSIPIHSINRDTEHVIIEGSVFSYESKDIKNERAILMIYMTDKTDSICVKMFVSQKKRDELNDYIKNGVYIRVEGRCEYDTFEQMTVVMADSIEKGSQPKREDDADPDRKRVELHAHTKMSRMDAVTEVADLVKQAKAWGHKAVAITDHGCCQGFPDAAKAAGGDIKVIYGVEGYLVETQPGPRGTVDFKSNPTYHIIILAKNATGLKNLYELVSVSYLDYFHKRPRMPREEIEKHREGLIIGSACEAGEVFRTMTGGGSDEDIMKVAEFYDYLEIQPRSNNMFMLEKGMVQSEEQLLDFNRKIVEIGDRMGKPVVATCDTHYLNPEDYIFRNIILAAQNYKDLNDRPSLYIRTTREMLEEFAYLGAEKAEEVVIDNTQMIADMVEEIIPVPKGKYPPKIAGAEDRLRNRCYEKAHSIYGDPLPELVQTRLDKELHSIIDNGYAVMYVAAELLVQKSLSDGYLVGSRGSVGSSFAATMDGITEVNPLPPHYICENPECKNVEFMIDQGFDCGVDMPDKVCPKCGQKYKKEGFNIPFETFLGFKGDKEPDIDLNFAGEYQPVAHRFVGEIFGEKNVFKAGTISTVQEKMAHGYVRKYYEERGKKVNKCEELRLALGCTGVRKTTGQHPGGIVICPEGHDIEEFCPVMHPSEGMVKDIVTTHFDYHKIDENLLKLDILGHDVPTMIRMLQDMTGIAPDDVPFDDKEVDSIFLGTDALKIKIDDYRQKHGTFGIPEFGTSFTRQMLDDTQPKKFSALVRIAGFSHGTDVWINNAQEFIKNGQATMDDAIATRDDIMNYLIEKGVPKQDSFWIMEHVRKGKGLKEDEEAIMRENNVPEWYIESCKRIKYMFPKAHAVAYVMMSYRIAYFKVHYPPEFYAVHFTIKIDAFNANVILAGMDAVLQRMDDIKALGDSATPTEKSEYLVYEVAYEMYARGFEFLPARLGHSQAVKFCVEDGKVRISFRALEGMGETAAKSLVDAYNDHPFGSVEDLVSRTSVNSSNVETLREHGVLGDMPETDQFSLFAML